MVLVTKKQKTPPMHHRKRQANHHKRGKDYDKHYWPFLPLLGIIGFGFLLNILWAPLTQSFQQHSVLGYTTGANISELLDDTNQQRVADGLANLQLNSQLNKAAQAKANDMAKRDYWAHVTPDGRQPWSFVSDAGYNYSALGENLAYGFDSSISTVSGWMNSPEHRANILNGNYDDVGFGIATADNYQGKHQQTIVVAMYGQPDENLSVAAAVRPQADTSSQAQAVVASGSATSSPIGVSFQVNNPAPARVVRMQTVANSVPTWSVGVTVAVISLAAAMFILRHSRRLHQAMLNGERFVLHHTLLDSLVVLAIVVGVLLTRTAGFIH